MKLWSKYTTNWSCFCFRPCGWADWTLRQGQWWSLRFPGIHYVIQRHGKEAQPVNSTEIHDVTQRYGKEAQPVNSMEIHDVTQRYGKETQPVDAMEIYDVIQRYGKEPQPVNSMDPRWPNLLSYVCFDHCHNLHRNISRMNMSKFNHGINPWQHKNKNHLFKVLQNIIK